MTPEERVAEILASWRERAERGDRVDPRTLLDAHPDLAGPLARALRGLGALEALSTDEGDAAVAHVRTLAPDRYRDFAPAGEGGMGLVYWAIDTDLNREVAFKVVRPSAQGSAAPPEPLALSAPGADTPASAAFETLKARFLQEAWVTASLTHPGIVPVYELGQTPQGVPYYTMRFVKGERTLADALREAATESIDARLRLLEPYLKVCDTVAYAHDRGVIHRDLKPVNVALGEFGEVVVLDWGLARLADRSDEAADRWRDRLDAFREAADLATVAGVLGTPGYMAPEAALGAPEGVTASSDVYSLGVILYELLTGRRPHAFETFAELLRRLRAEDPLPPREQDEAVPEGLSALAVRTLARDPAARPESAAALAEAVRAWQATSARAREAEALLARAESALDAAEDAPAEHAARHVDRAVAALAQARKLGSRGERAASLGTRLEDLRARALARREGAARRAGFRRAAIAASVVLALGSAAAMALLDAGRRRADEARVRAEEAEHDADRQREEAVAQTVSARVNLGNAYAQMAGALLADGGAAAARVAAATGLATHETERGWLALFEAESATAFAARWLPGTLDPTSWPAGLFRAPQGLALVESNGAIWLWPPGLDEPPRKIREGKEGADRHWRTAVDADPSGRVFDGRPDGTILAIDLDAPTTPKPYDAGDAAITAVAVSPDGRRLAFAEEGSGAAHVLAVDDGRELARLPSAGRWVLDLAWSADGGTLVAAGDKRLLAYDVQHAAQRWSIEEPSRRVTRGEGTDAWASVSYPDGTAVRVHGVDGSVLRRIGPLPSLVEEIAVPPGGRWIVTRDTSSGLEVHDLATGRRVAAPRIPRFHRVYADLALSPDGNRLFATVQPWDPKDRYYMGLPLAVRAYDLRTPRRSPPLAVEPGETWPATHGGLALDGAGATLAWGGQREGGNAIHLLDRRAGTVRTLPELEQTWGLQLSEDGRRAWFGTNQGEVVRFDLAAGKEEIRASIGTRIETPVAFSPDRTRLHVLEFETGALHTLDAASLDLLHTAGGDERYVSDAVAWPGSDRLLLVVGRQDADQPGMHAIHDLGLAFLETDGTIRALGLPAAGPVAARAGAGVRGAAWTYDGDVLLLDDEGSVIGRTAKAEAARLDSQPGALPGCSALAISPDGRWVLAAGHGWRDAREVGRLLLWRTDTGALVRDVPVPHRGAIHAIRFSPGGDVFYTLGDDVARAWDLALLVEAASDRREAYQARYGITIEDFEPALLPPAVR